MKLFIAILIIYANGLYIGFYALAIAVQIIIWGFTYWWRTSG